MDGFSQVLLIDDNLVQLKVREAVLRNAGFTVSTATTAESALATLCVLGDHIGLVVTDHVMPVCNGAEFVRQLRARNNWVPVVVLSGMPDAMSEYEGMHVQFRTKPTPPSELIELVRAGLAESLRQRGAA
ncbi:MAG: response regulator [Acidobacteriota bacterium]|nr:response regulator [Acidobacteriota bacterium]